MMLSSLPVLDASRASAAAEGRITRKGNVDVITFSENPTGSQDDVTICNLVYFMPLSRVKDGVRTVFNDVGTLEGSAAVLLAAQHLNIGNGTLVPDVHGLSDRCPIRFTMEILDTEYVENVALESVIKLTDRVLPERQPCAFVGAYRSAVSIPTSFVTGVRGYPQVGISISADLDDKLRYPLFGRTLPSTKGYAAAAVNYLRNVLDLRYISVIHTSDAFGTSYALGIQDAIADFAPDLQVGGTFVLRFGADSVEVNRVVTQLKQTESSYFHAVLFPKDADAVLKEAEKQGIAATGRHNWLFSDGIGNVGARKFERTSVLRQAYRGASVIRAATTSDDCFLAEALQEFAREENNLAYLKSILPKYRMEGSSTANGSALIHADMVDDISFLSSPGLYSGYLYDAAIALGLAACDAATNGNHGYFSGEEHYHAMIKNTTFDGTTGNVVFDNITGSRTFSSSMFEVFNFVENDQGNISSKTVKLKAVRTDIFENGKWTELEPYVFNDGTTTAPNDLPNISLDHHYISTELRVIALVMCATILLLSVSFSVWTQVLKGTRVIRASQPIFLHIICAGVFLLGSSIVPLSFDRGATSLQGSNVACMAFPWLLILGFSTTLSALYSKTHRINIIFKAKFRRVEVKPIDVAKPMFAILGANIIVLTVWTIVDPLLVTTEVLLGDRFGRPIDTFAFCDSNTKIPYVVTLGVINFVALFLTSFEAYNAKDISLEYSESKYIFTALAFIVTVCFIGIPVMFITRENPSASFFVWAGIIFVSSCGILSMIFIPKVWSVYNANDCEIASPNNSSGITILHHEINTTKMGLENVKLLQKNSKLVGEIAKLKIENAKLKQMNNSFEVTGITIASHED